MPRSTGNGQSTLLVLSYGSEIWSDMYGISINCDSFSVRILCGEHGELPKLMLTQRGGPCEKGQGGKEEIFSTAFVLFAKDSAKKSREWQTLWLDRFRSMKSLMKCNRM